MRNLIIALFGAVLAIYLTGCSDDLSCPSDQLPGDLPSFLDRCKEKLELWGIDVKMNAEKTAVIVNNQAHSLKKYRSRFDADLTIEIKDPERSEIILNAYFTHIEPHFRNSLVKKAFEDWLYTHHRSFGMQNFDYHDFLMVEPKLQLFNQEQKMIEAFDNFIKDINSGFKSKFQEKKVALNSPESIAIISGPYGGGHLSVAAELQNSLREAGNYSVKKIDECMEFQDPLAIVTDNKFRACRAFNDFARLEDDAEKARMIQHLNWLLSFYITPKQRGDLRRTLEQGGYSLLVLTVHHIFDINSMPYTTKIPSLIAITDFDHPSGQWLDYNFLDPRYSRYLVPRNDKLYFRRMFLSDDADQLSLYKRSKFLLTKLFEQPEQPGSDLSLNSVLPEIKVIDILGYPVNPVITFPKAHHEIIAARKNLNLNADPNRKIVTLSFGGAPNLPKLKQLMNLILGSKAAIKHKIQIALLAGRNEKLVEAAQDVFTKNGIRYGNDVAEDNSSDPILGAILPGQDAVGMSSVYKASDVILSKAGGATTAELLQSSTYYLRAFGLEPWEFENAIYLERHGLSVDSPASSVDSLNISYHPYTEDLSGEQLVVGLNEILNKPRLMSAISGYLSFDRPTFLDIVRKTIADFKKDPGY